VIVRCERCETRFKLDESRIPARGARVRCSRCKHAFFVTPPDVGKEEVVHAVAAAAAAAPAEAARAPEPSWDLEDGPGATLVRRKAPETPAAEDDDASDWRFEDDVPDLDPGASRSGLDLAGSPPAAGLVATPDPGESSFADLGDPETWDLLAGDPSPAATPEACTPAPEEPADGETRPASAAVAPGGAVAPAAEPAGVEPAPAPVAPAARPAIAAARSAFAPPAVVVPRTLPAAPRAPAAVAAAGWAGVALLVAAIAWGAWGSPSSGPATAHLSPIAGFEVSDARLRVVENAAAGPLLVVTGRLRNPGPAARSLGTPLEAQLLDADGAPIGGRVATLGAALPEARIREEAPEALLAAQQAAAAGFAATPVAAGAGLEFAAIFAPAPGEARGFALAPGRTR
jgi:predicted Zn finger-like uncharacterized protein